MTVHAGDLLHSDENGVVNIPTQKRDGLRDAIQQILSAERKIFDLARTTGCDGDDRAIPGHRAERYAGTSSELAFSAVFISRLL